MHIATQIGLYIESIRFLFNANSIEARECKLTCSATTIPQDSQFGLE